MNKSTFEEQLDRTGKLIYTNVGDSMMPLIRQGKDLMVIRKPKLPLKKYDVPLYRRDNGTYVLHRILKVRKDGYVICGDNRYAREYGITDRHIIGVLEAVIRDGKTLPVTDKKYKRYVHLWCDYFYIRAGILFVRSKWRSLRRKIRKRG